MNGSDRSARGSLRSPSLVFFLSLLGPYLLTGVAQGSPRSLSARARPARSTCSAASQQRSAGRRYVAACRHRFGAIDIHELVVKDGAATAKSSREQLSGFTAGTTLDGACGDVQMLSLHVQYASSGHRTAIGCTCPRLGHAIHVLTRLVCARLTRRADMLCMVDAFSERAGDSRDSVCYDELLSEQTTAADIGCGEQWQGFLNSLVLGARRVPLTMADLFVSVD